MATRTSDSVEAFFSRLPPERAAELARVRQLVLDNLPSGYREAVRKNMIVYEVPLERYGDTYNGEPLWYAALGAPKSYLTLHLMPVYGDKKLASQLADGFRSEGKKLDIGKACIHFKSANDLALDAVGRIVASTPMERWIAVARAARRR